jgi:hypothetical protein
MVWTAMVPWVRAQGICMPARVSPAREPSTMSSPSWTHSETSRVGVWGMMRLELVVVVVLGEEVDRLAGDLDAEGADVGRALVGAAAAARAQLRGTR